MKAGLLLGGVSSDGEIGLWAITRVLGQDGEPGI